MNVNEILFQGADYHYKNQLDEASACFKKVLQMEPDNAYAHNQLGLIYVKKRMLNEAIKEFEFVNSKDTNNIFCKIWLGLLSLQKEKWDTAKNYFEDTLKIDPQNADAFYYLGALYSIQHNPGRAIEMLKKSAEADVKEPDTHYRLADAFHSLDLVKSAQIGYQKTIDLNPKHTKAWNELGWIYFDQGNTDKALEAWQKAFSINKEDNETKFNLAHLHNYIAKKHLKNGEKTKAIQEWKKALEYFSKNYEAKYYINKYEKGE